MSNTFETKKQDLHGGITAYQSALQSKGEDRTVAFSFKHGSLIAIFDGHFSTELSEHTAKVLPQFVADSFDPADADVAGILTKIIEDFDQLLISNFIDLLPKYGWSDASREKADNVGSEDRRWKSIRICPSALGGGPTKREWPVQ
ncbi:hypothetical protein B0H10DRAFT_2442952 [Mycena sp. CBHHK59/15]|nr:hypothetical protein B0H10DRAFT_2442952 [Mycena sp. CBHHK59/15]